MWMSKIWIQKKPMTKGTRVQNHPKVRFFTDKAPHAVVELEHRKTKTEIAHQMRIVFCQHRK